MLVADRIPFAWLRCECLELVDLPREPLAFVGERARVGLEPLEALRRSACHSCHAVATSAASGSRPPCASSIARCAPERSSSWCACWPWMSTSRSPSSRSCASVADTPLIHAFERPPASIVRRSSSSPPSRHLAVVHLVARQPRVDRRVGREGGRQVGAGPALAHDARIAALAEQQRQRVDQDRLAGAGLAGEDGEAGLEFEVERVDDDEVADRERLQHRVNAAR